LRLANTSGKTAPQKAGLHPAHTGFSPTGKITPIYLSSINIICIFVICIEITDACALVMLSVHFVPLTIFLLVDRLVHFNPQLAIYKPLWSIKENHEKDNHPDYIFNRI